MTIAPSLGQIRRARHLVRPPVRRGAYLMEERNGHTLFHFVEGKNYFIGRAPECQLRRSEPGISRQHAIIRCQGEYFEIFDCASTNGVRVNGSLVRAQVLADADRISLGGVTFVFRMAEREL